MYLISGHESEKEPSLEIYQHLLLDAVQQALRSRTKSFIGALDIDGQQVVEERADDEGTRHRATQGAIPDVFRGKTSYPKM